MQSETVIATTFDRDPVDQSVCIADGYGIRIFVNRGHLVVADGIGQHRRERRYPRAGHRLRRVIVLGHTGYVTLEANRWLADVGIAYLHLDTDGRMLTASGALGIDQPALRRAQALALGTETGLVITRYLLDVKLAGQARVANRFSCLDVADRISRLRSALNQAGEVSASRSIEAAAAKIYWSEAWARQTLTFARRDERKVPDRWHWFESRRSDLAAADSPRRATKPANAILNYLYALGEAEAVLALRAVGLDPGLGFLHTDTKARDSAALDLLETVRPEIDAYVAQVLRRRVFARSDFVEQRDGTCRVLPPLTHELARTAPAWGKALGPHAEHLARVLAATADGLEAPPTPLTQAKRAARYPSPKRRSAARRPPQVALPDRTCPGCGTPISQRGRAWCDRCLPDRRAEHGGTGGKRRRGATNSPKSKAKQGAALRENQKAKGDWEQTHSGLPDAARYRAAIEPGLLGQPISAITAATGLSRAYASRIRRGLVVPHPRHWNNLKGLAAAPAAPIGGGRR